MELSWAVGVPRRGWSRVAVRRSATSSGTIASTSTGRGGVVRGISRGFLKKVGWVVTSGLGAAGDSSEPGCLPGSGSGSPSGYGGVYSGGGVAEPAGQFESAVAIGGVLDRVALVRRVGGVVGQRHQVVPGVVAGARAARRLARGWPGPRWTRCRCHTSRGAGCRPPRCLCLASRGGCSGDAGRAAEVAVRLVTDAAAASARAVAPGVVPLAARGQADRVVQVQRVVDVGDRGWRGQRPSGSGLTYRAQSGS